MAAEHPFSGALERARAIPSLDGLRAIAVCAVILSHSNGWAVAERPGALRYMLLALGQGGLGVQAFFIISGFLITTLLLNEIDRNSTIRLKSFYFRRSLRIFPPYYIYLITVASIGFVASRPVPRVALVAAATYTSDYFPYAWIHPFYPSWYTLHTWSLSVEEQFYVFWPILLKTFTRQRSIIFCGVVVLLAPLLRLGTVLELPVYGMAGQWFRLFHTDVDSLAMGCLLAFAFRQEMWRARFERCFHPIAILCACGFLLICARLFTHEPAWITAVVTITIANVCLAYVIGYVVLRPKTSMGAVLNWAPLRHVGLISYSLYLWQQVFLGPYAPFGTWLGNCVCIFACAEVSFWLIERPSLRLRAKLETRSIKRQLANGDRS